MCNTHVFYKAKNKKWPPAFLYALLTQTPALFGQEVIHLPADFASIQSAINASQTGDTIVVDPGTYTEHINFKGKDLVVGSRYLTTGDTAYISQTIVDANQEGIALLFENGESPAAVFTGFTVMNGYAAKVGAYIALTPVLQSIM